MFSCFRCSKSPSFYCRSYVSKRTWKRSKEIIKELYRGLYGRKIACSGICFVFPFFYCLLMFKKAWGHIPILFQHFWNFQNVHQIWSFPPLIYHRNTSENTRTNPKSCLKNLIFAFLNISEIQQLHSLESMGPQKFEHDFEYFDKYLLTGPTQSSISIVLNKNGKTGWWNISKSWMIVDDLKS